ncbi:hypothetical protein OC846_006161 [Tilletia horrida]|uniref:Uncharacterized protein n=1 Tax=Tilletia horrida TaxID=155126 RepID=A0AAN6JVA8_9BASI|nr:hypothetical protein OC846_006161 [Tilletia horrida]
MPSNKDQVHFDGLPTASPAAMTPSSSNNDPIQSHVESLKAGAQSTSSGSKLSSLMSKLSKRPGSTSQKGLRSGDTTPRSGSRVNSRAGSRRNSFSGEHGLVLNPDGETGLHAAFSRDRYHSDDDSDSDESITRASYPLDLAAMQAEEMRSEASMDYPQLLLQEELKQAQNRAKQRSAKAGKGATGDELEISSTQSIKSWRSDPSGSSISGTLSDTNVHLSKPLIELEEFELENFMKNFSRHTREVRVPFAPTATRRMPQWSDFRIPPNEAEEAAAEGRRVTVLTHVDRGLQAILRDSEGAAQAGSLPPDRSQGDNTRRKAALATAEKSASLPTSAGPAATTHAGPDSKKKSGKKSLSMARSHSQQNSAVLGDGDNEPPRVKWAQEPESLSTRPTNSGSAASPPTQGSNVAPSPNASSTPDKSGNKRHSSLFHDLLGRDHHTTTTGTGDMSASLPVTRQAASLGNTEDELSTPDDGWEVIDGVAVKHEDGKALLDDMHGLDPATERDGKSGSGLGRDDDQEVDTVAFVIAYILALVERYAPEELDNGAAAMIYFVLWYTDLIPTAFMLSLLYYILQFRFFPPSESFLHEQVRRRMTRGIEADKFSEQLRRRSRLDLLDLYKRWIERFGIATQIAAGDIADFHEKVKNLILWRNPTATWRTFTLLSIATVFVTFAPAHYVWKTAFLFLGLTFFILLPLQSHYPRYRRPLSPIWWALWGAPTDFVWGSKILRERHATLHGQQFPRLSNNRSKEGKQNVYTGLFHMKSKHNRHSSHDPWHSSPSGTLDALATGVGSDTVSAEENDEVRQEILEQAKEAQRGKKLASFFCQHHTVPGHLHVTTRMIYFVALHSARPSNSRKTCKTELSDIAGLVKTNNFGLFGFHGLKVRKRDGKSIHFSNMSHRDDAFNLILSVTGSVWSKV